MSVFSDTVETITTLENEYEIITYYDWVEEKISTKPYRIKLYKDKVYIRARGYKTLDIAMMHYENLISQYSHNYPNIPTNIYEHYDKCTKLLNLTETEVLVEKLTGIKSHRLTYSMCKYYQNIPALYNLYNKKGEVIYTGKTKYLQQRLKQHSHSKTLQKETYYISHIYEYVKDSNHENEKILIKYFSPKYNYNFNPN